MRWILSLVSWTSSELTGERVADWRAIPVSDEIPLWARTSG
jgi:hypothetical protein